MKASARPFVPSSSTMRASATPSPSTPRACPTSAGSSRPCSRRARSRRAPGRRPVHHDRRPRAEGRRCVGVASLSADGVWTRARPIRDPDRRLHPLRACVRQEPRRGDGREHERHRHRDRRRRRQARGLDQPERHLLRRCTDAFTVEQVYDYGFSLRKAGPIGQASVADADGNPWVAYTVNAPDRRCGSRRSRRRVGTQTVATIRSARAARSRNRPVSASAGPTVAWVDTDAEHGDGLGARRRRVGRQRGGRRRERAGPRYGGRRRRQRYPHVLRR